MNTIKAWGSHPAEGNDDCWYGEDNVLDGDIDEVVEKYLMDSETAYVEVVGVKIVKNYNFKKPIDDSEEWCSEFRMQNAMAFGVQGWNDCD